MSSEFRRFVKPWREVVNLAKKVNGMRVRVGIFEGELAEIALIHEYGAPRANIPERSFIRATFAIRRAEIIEFQNRIYKLMMARKIDETKAMNLIGAYLVGLCKEQIVRYGPLIFQPLKEATIAAKNGKTSPLIDTGQLVNGITWVIVP